MQFFYDADDLKTMAAKAVRMAQKAGATACEARIGEDYHKEIRVRCRRLDGAESSSELGVSVCVYDGKRKGAASVGELSAAAMQLAVSRALALARESAADVCFGLADGALMAREFRQLALYHPHSLSDDDAFDMAGRCEEAAFAADGKISKDKSEGASVYTAASQSVYANSHGFCAAEQTTMHGISCTALAEQNGAMEQDGWSDSARKFEDLPSPESIGTTAGQLAAARLGGKRLKSAQVPVLFRAPVSHSLILHLVRAASGGALYRNLSWLAVDELNKRQVCAPHLNVIENPFLLGGFRSGNFDGEGVALQKRDIVGDGIWRGCFLGSYTARRLKMQTTGNAGGAHNLIVSGRQLPFGALLREMGRGFLVCDLMGSTINPVTGDYSRGASGFWVEGGEIIHPVNEATIAGNVCDILNNIVALGDDDNRRRGAVKCGSVLVDGMTVGGQ